MGQPERLPDARRWRKNVDRMKVDYSLGLEDHLAWYDYYCTTEYGRHEKSWLPLVGKYLDRVARYRYGRRVGAKGNEAAFGERSLELRGDGVREFFGAYDFTSAWGEIVLVAATSSHLFLAHASMNAHIVPLHAFGSEAERAAFMRCAETRGGSIREIANEEGKTGAGSSASCLS